MRKPISISTVAALLLLAPALAHANLTERLEAKFLKSRIKLRIDEDWKVKTGNISGAQATTFDDTSWTPTSVPHDMSITLYQATNAGTTDPGALGWYRKHFTLPLGFAGKKVIVQFDGVYHDSKIYLNGTQVGSQQYGYVSFYCDLEPYLNATGDNVLAVFVDNQTVRNSRWYSGTGIFRHVWLIATDKVYVRNWGTAVTTPVVATTESQISVQTDLMNELTTDQQRTVETTIYDEDGNALKSVSTPVTVPAGSAGTTCTQTLTLAPCKLWSPSTPVRYYAYTRVLNGTTPADDTITPFGIRELKFTPGTGFFINGVSTKLKGVCMHHMEVPVGAAVPERMWERIIKELLESGATSIRTSHNPVSPEFLDLCDQYGMLVMNEFTDKWSQASGGVSYENWDQNWQKDLKGFIERDRNHPSVVLWSAGNEVAYGGTIPAYITTTMGQLVPYINQFDKTRPVIHACNIQDAAGMVSLAKIQNNIAGLNYGEGIYAKIHSLDPNVLICGTEQAPYLADGKPTWSSVKDSPYVIGHHLWMGVDFLGEGIGKGGGPSGYLDYCGFRKAWFYYQKSQWTDTPVVHIGIGDFTQTMTWSTPEYTESWNQSGPVTVTTYTNCDTVDLYVNSTKIGTKKLADFPNMIMQWTNVPWTAGVIKAVGMKGGVEVATDSITTAGPAAKVVLKPDRTTLYADGDDVSDIEVDIMDANDVLVADASNTVQFTVTGAGRSLGIANADWTSSDPYKATSRKAYRGKVLIVIQSTMTPGTIKLTVSSGTLTPADLTIGTLASSGAPSTGGASGSGGSAIVGGATGAGGVSGSGGSPIAGGTTSGGGTSGGGGFLLVGGTTSTGGTSGGGGSTIVGGTTSAGGRFGSGGFLLVGGAAGTGGIFGNGGSPVVGSTTSTSQAPGGAGAALGGDSTSATGAADSGGTASRTQSSGFGGSQVSQKGAGGCSCSVTARPSQAPLWLSLGLLALLRPLRQRASRSPEPRRSGFWRTQMQVRRHRLLPRCRGGRSWV
jgi:beta-galactosidase